MDFLKNFGHEQLQSGQLNNMLEQVGIDNVGEYVNQFRNQANHEADKVHEQREDDGDEDSTVLQASNQQANWMSMGSSLINQFSGRGGQGEGGGGGGGGNVDMIQGAMKAYKMFSGGSGNNDSEGGGGGFLDNISSQYQNAQQMYAMYKQFDKNGDGQITVEDVQILLQEMGLGFASNHLAKALFSSVDTNHNGKLDFTDLMALASIVKKLQGQFGPGQ